jgi:hypothetical protein
MRNLLLIIKKPKKTEEALRERLFYKNIKRIANYDLTYLCK